MNNEAKQPADMLKVIAEAVGMQAGDYRVKCRGVVYTDLRTIGALLLREYYPDIRLTEMGYLFGTDHTSVIHNMKVGNGYLSVHQQPFLSKYLTAKQLVEQWITK